MLISKQQQYMLDVLHRLGSIREDQLAILLKTRFFPDGKLLPHGFVNTLLRQFACCNIDLRLDRNVVSLPHKVSDPNLLEAIDIMLELSQNSPLEFWAAETGPVLLRFSVAGKRISLFAVLHEDDLKGTDVRAPPSLGPTERVVILLSGEGRPPDFHVPNTQFYALRQKDGTHRFFAKETIKSF